MFNEHELEYFYSDSDDAIAFSVRYEHILIDQPLKHIAKNPMWNFAAIPFVFLALFAVTKGALVAESTMQAAGAGVMAGFWLLVAGLFYVKYRRSTVVSTLLLTPYGRLCIVHDGQQQDIFKALQDKVSAQASEDGTDNPVH